MSSATVTRDQVLAFRFRRHQLDRAPGTARGPDDVDLLDLGVQDTGPDGSAWALALRGLEPAAGGGIALAWTLRGAPHAYRRADLAGAAVATSPLSEADAAKRVFDAAKPLKAAGIEILDALRTVAEQLRSIVDRPRSKGEVSSALTEALDEPFLRWCRPCGATHVYEQPFRLAALQAALELEPGTSPPVLRRIPKVRPAMFRRPGSDADARLDVVRNHVRFYGPARPREVAAALDAPVASVAEHWPHDAVEVTVSGAPTSARSEPWWMLPDDAEALEGGGPPVDRVVRLLGPYDPFLQLRDRELLVPDAVRRKELWPVLGRPGAIVAGGALLGTWRPRSSGKRLTVLVEPWGRMRKADRSAVEAEAERLAAHRGVTLARVADA